MSGSTGVIIRLQNLPWEAVSSDVREFFRGLHIPDGGVHIVGGKDGDAFIAFSTDEDARQAMRLDGKRIKNSKIKLYLSSRVEMQQLIEKARMELQHGGHYVAQAPSEKDRSGGKRRRSRSRSPERRRRSRSRSPNRSTNRGGNVHPRNDGRPPLFGPPTTTTTSVPPAEGNRMPAPFQMDRNSHPSPFIDPHFLDRNAPIRPPPINFPPRRPGEVSPILPRGDEHNPAFGGRLPNKVPPFRPPLNAGDRFGNENKIIRPAMVGPPMEPFHPPVGPPKFNERPPFSVPPPTGPRPEIRFDGGILPTPNVNMDRSPPLLPNNVQAPPPASASSRASRRALLPMPPEETLETGQNLDGDQHPAPAVAETKMPEPFPRPHVPPDSERPNPEIFTNLPQPFVDHRFNNEWPAEGGGFTPHSVSAFPFMDRPPLERPPVFDSHPIKKPVSLCVAMTAVPSSLLRYGAIREFFDPLNLEGNDKIKIPVDDRGERRTGQVYCKFSSPKDAETALTYAGKEKIYIRSCSDEEFDQAIDGGVSKPRSDSKDRDVDSYRSRSRDNSRHHSSGSDSRDSKSGVKDAVHVIEITNIPYKAIQADLVMLLSRFDPIEIRRLYKYHVANGRVVTSDTAFAIFSNEKDKSAALRSKDSRIFERNIRMQDSSIRVMEDAFAKSPAPPPEAMAEWKVRKSNRHDDRRFGRHDKSPPRSPRRASPELPYPRPTSPYRRPVIPKVEEKQEMWSTSGQPSVSKFPFTCVFMKGFPMNSSNQDVAAFFTGFNIAPNGIRILKSTPGTAYVEFANASECEKAFKKDRSYMGTQMVTLRPCTKEEMMESVQKQFGMNGNGGGNGPIATQASNNGNSIPQIQQPPRGNVTWNQDVPSNTNLQAPPPVAVNASQTNLLYLQQLAALAKQQEEKANSQLHIDLGDTTHKAGDAVPEASSDMPAIDPEVISMIGGPGCVAALHNLPPHVTLEEICELFQGYQLIDDSIRMHYSNTGEPTGDCLLAFATPHDAQAATTALNGSKLTGQQIKMYVVGVQK